MNIHVCDDLFKKNIFLFLWQRKNANKCAKMHERGNNEKEAKMKEEYI